MPWSLSVKESSRPSREWFPLCGEGCETLLGGFKMVKVENVQYFFFPFKLADSSVSSGNVKGSFILQKEDSRCEGRNQGHSQVVKVNMKDN